ncbi:MAG: aspartate/glutamate racemase family protein [Devosia sp.]
MTIALVNPNTSTATTEAMVAIAQDAAGGSATIKGVTAHFGASLITEPGALSVAADAVLALAPTLGDYDGVIVAAFGDPGLHALRERLPCPVTGIAEAGMAEAAKGGRRFAVVTTTPDLRGAIAKAAAFHGHEAFAGTFITPGDPHSLMTDDAALVAALGKACGTAIAEGGAEAVVIGGGPLARAARVLASTVEVPLIEPVPAAVRLSLVRLQEMRQT